MREPILRASRHSVSTGYEENNESLPTDSFLDHNLSRCGSDLGFTAHLYLSSLWVALEASRVPQSAVFLNRPRQQRHFRFGHKLSSQWCFERHDIINFKATQISQRNALMVGRSHPNSQMIDTIKLPATLPATLFDTPLCSQPASF